VNQKARNFTLAVAEREGGDGMSSSNHTFVHQIQNLIEWIDNDAKNLRKDEILDGVKIRALVMAKKFIAYPHCQNFSLMPQPKE
jgi:hypothetical protein